MKTILLWEVFADIAKSGSKALCFTCYRVERYRRTIIMDEKYERFNEITFTLYCMKAIDRAISYGRK